MEVRDITLSDDGIARLANAVEKADKRGGKESLVMMDNLAFIVNIKDRLVITAMDSDNRGEGVFTKIDSVVFADPSTSEESADNNNIYSA
jgi:flagellar operon protein